MCGKGCGYCCGCCDPRIKTCWSPCFWHSTVRSGSYAVAGYTLGMALCLLTYTAYIMQGGDSSQFYLPLFETDLNGEMQPAGQFVILYMLAMIVVSLLLMWGIRRDIRGLMLPWMVGMFFALLFQLMFGMWLIFGYYIYLEGVFAALVDFAWLAYNTYCWQVVRNYYRNVKWFQSPDIEVLDEFVK